MKYILLLFTLVFFDCQFSFAQTYSIKNDTIFVGNKEYALFQLKSKKQYYIQSVRGENLIEIHYTNEYIKNKPMYVVYFLNDKKKASLAINNHNNISRNIISEIVAYKLINNGISINEDVENKYIGSHPLPTGYTDINELIEY